MSKISDMPFTDNIEGTEMVEIVQKEGNKRTNPNVIAEHANKQVPNIIKTFFNDGEETIDLGLL